MGAMAASPFLLEGKLSDPKAALTAGLIDAVSEHPIKDAKKWMNSGINGLHYSMDLMVLNDGFFFESSMNYHRFAIELFLYPYIISQKISYSFEKIYILKLQKMFDLIFFSFKSFNFPKPEAARSLAIPRTPRQSGLLGVIDRSIRLEFDIEK